MAFLSIFTKILSRNESESKTSPDIDLDIHWNTDILQTEDEKSISDYINSAVAEKGFEPSLDQINSWLSGMDEVEEIWGDVNQSYRALRVSRLTQPGSYSDETYMAADLGTPYIVKEDELPSGTEYYIVDVSVGGTSFGLPEAKQVASINYNQDLSRPD